MAERVSASTANSERVVGRSGRRYRIDTTAAAREGGMASVRAVIAEGPPNALSLAEAGTSLALKLSRADDALAMEAMVREVEVFAALCRAPGEPPCPRLYDVIGSPPVGIVMEWCPNDLERWWAERADDPAAFPQLCGALAEVCRRVREYAAVSEVELGKRVVHADIKPRNVLLAESGRWLLTDFGASKSRMVDEQDWAATKMILGTENFIAPEALFNAKKPLPAALDTWSIGCTFFALLRMRPLLRGGGKLPANGTHAHHFRTHRAALVADLHLRKPAIFADRELDPRQFVSPDRLPDKDRVAVADALSWTFAQPALEERLVADVTNLLDRALQIDPARRYTDSLEMASDFEALAIRWRELAIRADGGATGPRSSAPAIPPPSSARIAPMRRSGSGWTNFFAITGCLLVMFAMVVVMLGGGGAVWYFGTSGPNGQPVAALPTEERTKAAEVMAEPVVIADPPVIQPVKTKAKGVKPEPLPAVSTETGTLLVMGAGAYIVGSEGRRSTGTVPAGAYEVFAAIGPAESFVSVGTVQVGGGERVTFRCGFGTCKRAGQ